MPDSLTFTVDVFRSVCDRFQSKASELRLMVETGESFKEWLVWEAFLACKLQQASYPFCEVAVKPTYASEGVDSEESGDLRIGGPNDGADHCWVFAEFVLLHDGNRAGERLRSIEAEANKLLRLGWKKSASLLIVVAASQDDAGSAMWNQPALTDPLVIPLSGGGSVVIKAFDIKRNPTDTLTESAR